MANQRVLTLTYHTASIQKGVHQQSVLYVLLKESKCLFVNGGGGQSQSAVVTMPEQPETV